MKIVIIFALVFFNMISAQKSEDVTKKVIAFFKSNDIGLYGAKILIAEINAEKYFVIEITQEKGIELVLSGEKLLLYKTMRDLLPFFSSAKLILNKFPDIKYYSIKSIDLKEIVNDYGDSVNTKRIILWEMGMTKETILKVNWKFVDVNLFHSISYGLNDDLNKIINMCDVFVWRDKNINKLNQ